MFFSCRIWCVGCAGGGVLRDAASAVAVAAYGLSFLRSTLILRMSRVGFHSSLSIFSVQGRGAGHRAILGILASSIGVDPDGAGGSNAARNAGGRSHIAVSDSII